MKKSIAFLGALLFGSVTFGQVTKNDSIKKLASRKLSTDDLKNISSETDNEGNGGYLKGESKQRIKGGVIQKGREGKILVTQEKQSSTPISPFKGGEIQKTKANENQTIEKKHVSNIKWSGDKVKKDSIPTPTSKTSGNFLKIGDIKGEK